MTDYDGSGRKTAQEIRDTWGDDIVAGSSQIDERGLEVFPSFLTRRLYGAYNWQTATYTIEPR